MYHCNQFYSFRLPEHGYNAGFDGHTLNGAEHNGTLCHRRYSGLFYFIDTPVAQNQF
ncbi:MAG: hypothetical protein IJM09_01845 [Neisseriaceae bacterium]|nr:hypothetical protein [Neisseriaceae bacterium]MBR1819403.1 hypothetical protein [Neisseriaceae bacterium]